MPPSRLPVLAAGVALGVLLLYVIAVLAPHAAERKDFGFSLTRVEGRPLVTTVRGDGVVDMDNRFEPFGTLPPLPRIGLVIRVAGEFEHFTWHGRGPFENYSDRKQSADMGTWSSTVTEQFVPYVRPQENGNKEDVRWLALADERDHGLNIERPVFRWRDAR